MSNANYSPTLQASSAIRKAGMSITLPRNFAPLSLSGSGVEPRTPDQTFAELSLPPPPVYSTYRIRRPRVGLEGFQTRNSALPALLFASEIRPPSSPLRPRSAYSIPPSALRSDEVLPSIESPTTSSRPGLLRGYSEPMNTDYLDIPVPHELPRTPPAQTKVATPNIKRGQWDMQRAASVCSTKSDSSVSSNNTSATRPTSFDGSATSADCDNQDPFSPQLVKIIPDTPTRKNKKMRINTSLDTDNTRWTVEMDNHLFNVYHMYLADPTVTPFKTVPGSIPPTGVCHRVARRAKETWPKASKIDVPIVKRYRVRNLPDIRRNIREKTPELNDFLRTDSSIAVSDARMNWPSESATRKRLKQLCRDKFTISAHYQRLRESRSPSPFSDQFTRRPLSRSSRSVSRSLEETDQPLSTAARELGISLIASDATAPLARLTGADIAVMGHPEAHGKAADDWFNTPITVTTDVDMSTPSAPLPEPDKLAPLAANIPRLASPFNYSTWNGASSKNANRRHITHNQYGTMHATGSRLLSPFQPEMDPSNLNKRRAQRSLEDELSPRGSNLSLHSTAMNLDGVAEVPAFQPKAEEEVVFTGAGDINQRRIRLRNRGATLASAAPTSGQERIRDLFRNNGLETGITPPMPQLPSFAALEHPALAQPENSGGLRIPELDPKQRRLGSPFELDPSKRSLRHRPARHVPSLSDPFISVDHFGIGGKVDHGISNISNENHGIGNINERLELFNRLHRDDH